MVRGIEWKLLITSRMQPHPTTRQNVQFLGVFVQCNGNCKETFVFFVFVLILCFFFVRSILRMLCHAMTFAQRVDLSRTGRDSAGRSTTAQYARFRLPVSRAVRRPQRWLHSPTCEPHFQPQGERLGLLGIHCSLRMRCSLLFPSLLYSELFFALFHGDFLFVINSSKELILFKYFVNYTVFS